MIGAEQSCTDADCSFESAASAPSITQLRRALHAECPRCGSDLTSRQTNQ